MEVSGKKGKYKKIISNFNTEKGTFCALCNTKSLFEYYGYKLSEAMYCGLSGYLGFFYTREDIESREILYGRIGNHDIILKNLCNALNIKLNERTIYDDKEAWVLAKESLNRNIPLLLCVDDFYLEYHFYFNKIHYLRVVDLIGFDEKEGTVFLYDIEKRTNSIENFKRARNSEVNGIKTNNMWYEFEFPIRFPPLIEPIKNSINKTVKIMLDKEGNETRFYGTAGIRTFAEDIGEWMEKWEKDELYANIENMYVQINRPGGPTVSRSLFSKFLFEASGVINNKELYKIGREFEEISKAWEIIGNLFFKWGAGAYDVIPRIQSRLIEIADKEEQLFTTLRDIIA
ncbi:MAG: DUF4872 domain-containing protein [bacterium]|nr:DUF4872 domain-containing protein [bacterium]